MSIGPVPYTAVLEWARHHDLGFELTDHLWMVIRLIDSGIRNLVAKEAP